MVVSRFSSIYYEYQNFLNKIKKDLKLEEYLEAIYFFVESSPDYKAMMSQLEKNIREAREKEENLKPYYHRKLYFQKTAILSAVQELLPKIPRELITWEGWG